MLDPKNTAIVLLLAVIIYFIRDKRQTVFNSSLHNVIHSTYLEPQAANEKLRAHSAEFNKPEIIKVTDGLYVAIGYALANSLIIEGDTSLIIVDTMESVESGIQVRKDFALSTPPSVHNKPIKTIIYTHYHPDHTFGSAAFVDDVDNPPTIISHPRTLKEMMRIFSIASTITNIRATKQFGPLLYEYDQNQKEQHNHQHHHSHEHMNHNHFHFHDHSHEHEKMQHGDIDNNNKNNNSSQNGERDVNALPMFNVFENSGIGPFLRMGPRWSKSLLLPTKLLYDERTPMNIDGVEFLFVHAPGETTDQIFVYLPEKRALLPADNIYKAFPNIYAIRGTPTRDARDWTKSLDAMRTLEPAPMYLVPCHTKPVIGKEKVQKLLTDYRDGIAYVHDQTIRYMNTGLTPSQMIPLIREYMPQRLMNHPYLQEFYGTIDWSVRGIFQSYLGWFSGDAADLFPLSKTETGDRLIALVEDDMNRLFRVIQDNLPDNLRDARDDANTADRNSCQWAVTLATDIMQSSKANEDERQIAQDLRIKGLQCLSTFMTSANGRNYYLTSSLEEITGSHITTYDKLKDFALNNMPLDHVISMLRVRLKVDVVPDGYKYFNVCHDFHDVWFYLEIRDGVVELFKGHNESKYGEEDEIVSSLSAEAHIERAITKEQCHEKAQLVTLCTEQVFRDAIAATKTSPAMLYAAGKFKIVKGQLYDMVQFREMFEQN